jgi:hypothetical protein
MQQMEWREELSDMYEQTDPFYALGLLESQVNQKIKNNLTKLKGILESELSLL